MQIIQIASIILFGVFCLLILIQSLKLKRSGIKLSKSKPISKRIITPLLLLAFFLLYVTEMIDQSRLVSFSIIPVFLRNNLHHSVWIAITGTVILLFSLVTICFTLIAFKESLRYGLDSSNTGILITNGIFAYSRNPFFISIEFLFIGIALIFTTPFFILIAVSSVISIHFFILKEEKFMYKNYGEEYRNYQKRVRRYF